MLTAQPRSKFLSLIYSQCCFMDVKLVNDYSGREKAGCVLTQEPLLDTNNLPANVHNKQGY